MKIADYLTKIKFTERSCLKNKFLKVRSAANTKACRLTFQKGKKGTFSNLHDTNDNRHANF